MAVVQLPDRQIVRELHGVVTMAVIPLRQRQTIVFLLQVVAVAQVMVVHQVDMVET